MRTFKQQLDRSIERHFKERGEIITTFYVATQLWVGSQPKTQRVLLSRALNNGLTLKVGHVQILMDIFPDTLMSEWVNVTPAE